MPPRSTDHRPPLRLVAVDAPAPAELVLTRETRLTYAWAAYRRVYGKRTSRREPVTGAELGSATELLAYRERVRLDPDIEEWIETLQVNERAIVAVYLPMRIFTPSDDDHDCDCTCAGEDGHARWEEGPAQWQPLQVFDLLDALRWGEDVRVRLAPG